MMSRSDNFEIQFIHVPVISCLKRLGDQQLNHKICNILQKEKEEREDFAEEKKNR